MRSADSMPDRTCDIIRVVVVNNNYLSAGISQSRIFLYGYIHSSSAQEVIAAGGLSGLLAWGSGWRWLFRQLMSV